MATEGAHHHRVLEQLERRLREQDLAAVSRRGDPRRSVHIDPAVLSVHDERFARMQPHPDAEVAAGERVLRSHGPGQRLARTGKGGEEAVALGAELDAVASVHLLAENVAVLGQRLAVPLRAELLEQGGRPLDVGEQQRDRSGRKLSHDPGGMITRRERGRRRRRLESVRAPRDGRGGARPSELGADADLIPRSYLGGRSNRCARIVRERRAWLSI